MLIPDLTAPAPTRPAARTTRLRWWQPPPLRVSSEVLILIASLYWSVSANLNFLRAVVAERDASFNTWIFGTSMLLLVFALHSLLAGLAATRLTLKPVLTVLTCAAAGTSYFIGHYGVVFDPSMIRNVLRTDLHEAQELISWGLAVHLLVFAILPCWLLWQVELLPLSWRQGAQRRALLLGVSLLVLLATIWLNFQPFAALMRNHREARYLVTPANVIWSTAQAMASTTRDAALPRQPIGVDARAGASWPARTKPLVVILVVGETVRAANWGAYRTDRDTTPRLARLPLVRFAQVETCGTNTEVSLPCMFAPVGRRAYDESRIRREQSLLHVVQRAGVKVAWRDNQSGCKGVCEGLPTELVSAGPGAAACASGRCLDEMLFSDLEDRLRSAQGTQIWVLHMLGNHGPSYFRRHPPEFARFLPECRDDDLRQCSREAITNAYDNALLYTDHLLAEAITTLTAHADRVDSALIYVSDHGESLGEKGLYLHGMPYALAPREQTHVPMEIWSSRNFAQAAGLRNDCLAPALQRAAAGRVSHEHLFHTLLGLLDIKTALYAPQLDLAQACRR